MFRSSCPEVLCKKSFLRIFAKFTGKHLFQSLLLKKSLWRKCFPVNLVKFLRVPFLQEHLRWLLLNFVLTNMATKLDAANTCSHPQMFSKKSEFKGFAIFLGKHLSWSLFLTLLQKRLQHSCFLVSFAKFLRTTIFVIDDLYRKEIFYWYQKMY